VVLTAMFPQNHVALLCGAIPPGVRQRIASCYNRLPQSELRESPPLGGLGRAWDFHRISHHVQPRQ
jgi:hypothetical protein